MRDRFMRDFVELVQRAGTRACSGFARSIDYSRHLAAVIHHSARKGEAPFFNRLHRVIGCTGPFARKLLAFSGEGSEDTAALFREKGGHFASAAADGFGDLIGLADEAAETLFSHLAQTTFL